MLTPKNARSGPVTRLGLALETFRRTEEGRVRDAKAFLGHYFPQDNGGSTDRLFVHLPNAVRADLLSNWGIRGKKSALRDDDDKVRTTITDALNAGDIDANVIEEGVTPEILVDWVPLEDWWSFWRGSALPPAAVRKALATARDLSLYDERWFIEHLTFPSRRLAGTDVVAAALSKEQLANWIEAIHESGDASPKGLVAALGWETLLATTPSEALLFVLDALARQIGLATSPLSTARTQPSTAPAPNLPATVAAATQPKNDPASKPGPASVGPKSSRPPPPAAATRALPARPSAPPPVEAMTRTPPPAAPSPAGVALALSAVVKQPTRSVVPTAEAIPGPSAEPTKPTRPASVPPPLPPITGSRPSASAPARELLNIIIEPEPAPAPVTVTAPAAAPLSTPPTARSLFGVPELPPMRPPARTLSGVGEPMSPFDPISPFIVTTEVTMPAVPPSPEEPAWAPPRAEPGDMGWDIVHGTTQAMGTNVKPKYHFEDDDEPTSEIALPDDGEQS